MATILNDVDEAPPLVPRPVLTVGVTVGARVGAREGLKVGVAVAMGAVTDATTTGELTVKVWAGIVATAKYDEVGDELAYFFKMGVSWPLEAYDCKVDMAELTALAGLAPVVALTGYAILHGMKLALMLMLALLWA
jgi:hypothetical protein